LGGSVLGIVAAVAFAAGLLVLKWVRGLHRFLALTFNGGDCRGRKNLL
jgi:hypothetical protein